MSGEYHIYPTGRYAVEINVKGPDTHMSASPTDCGKVNRLDHVDHYQEVSIVACCVRSCWVVMHHG